MFINNMLWKNWKRTSRGTYWAVKLPEHPKASKSGYVFEHRVIMENIINRLLTDNEVVHHINKDGKDNRKENLQLLSRSKHSSNHNKIKGIKMVELSCPFCKNKFHRRHGKTTLVKSVAKLNFCSRQCSGKFSNLSKDEQIKRGKGNIGKIYRIYPS